MVTFTEVLAIYTIGGLTFVPLLLGLVLLHAHLTFPTRDTSTPPTNRSSYASTISNGDAHSASREVKEELEGLPEELRPRTHEPDVAAGYFAVYRDFMAGWLANKPLEKAAAVNGYGGLPNESPSVYQSMYRSIFDRSKNAPPSMEKNGKRGSNVFFVVLRHGHLMLYDNAEQLEVRHVISLAYHDVDIYGGGEIIPDGELFVKRNCLRLKRKRLIGDTTPESKPFYLYTDNCSMKEDFYHALVQSQEHDDSPPLPLKFEPTDIVRLVQQLHASEENLQTRWFNAIMGRVFLSMYKTRFIENFIRLKVTKKIARVQKPAFITSLTVRHIHMGDSAPMITNPKLKELTLDGQLTCEADLSYKGNFRIEIGAILRIDLGQRFKAREVEVVLASIFKSIEGHILLRIKPPPTNRIWFSFETMPKLEMTVEPIVSSRQITYGFILRTIENRIREVFGETLVLPNWDDTPFFDTTEQQFRAGIWENDQASAATPTDKQTAAAHHGLVDLVDKGDAGSEDEETTPPLSSTPPDANEKAISMPSLLDSIQINQRPPRKSPTSVSLDNTTDITKPPQGFSSSVDASSPRPEAAAPKAMRSRSFASAATPVVSADQATTESLTASPPPQQNVRRKFLGGKKDKSEPKDAASAMKDISARSMSSLGMANESALQSPVGTPPEQSGFMGRAKGDSLSSTSSKDSNGLESSKDQEAGSLAMAGAQTDGQDESTSSLATAMKRGHSTKHSVDSTRSFGDDIRSITSETSHASNETARSSGSLGGVSRSGTSLSEKHHRKPLAAARAALTDPETRQTVQASVNAAVLGARKWGLGVLQRQASARAARNRLSVGSQDGGQYVAEGGLAAATQEEETTDGTDVKGEPLVLEDNSGHGETTPRPSMAESISRPASSSSTADRPARKRNVSSGNVELFPTHLSKTMPMRGAPGSPGAPIGRGRPLPPPGVPLPGPERERQTWVGSLVGLGRKKVPGGQESPGLSALDGQEGQVNGRSRPGSVSSLPLSVKEQLEDANGTEDSGQPSVETTEERAESAQPGETRSLTKQPSRGSIAEPSKPIRRIPVPVINTSISASSEPATQTPTPTTATPAIRPSLSKRHSTSTLSPDSRRSSIPIFSDRLAEELAKTPPPLPSQRRASPGGSRIPNISRSSSTESRRTHRTISPRPSSVMLGDLRVSMALMGEDAKEQEPMASISDEAKVTSIEEKAQEDITSVTTNSSSQKVEEKESAPDDLLPEPLPQSPHRHPKPPLPPRHPKRSSADASSDSSDSSTLHDPVNSTFFGHDSSAAKAAVSPLSTSDQDIASPASGDPATHPPSNPSIPGTETNTETPAAPVSSEPSPIIISHHEYDPDAPVKRRPVPKPPLPKRHEHRTVAEESKEKDIGVGVLSGHMGKALVDTTE